jgi:prolyl 4-hydroxylase
MVGQNFDTQIARGLVNAFVTARAEGMPPLEGSVTLQAPKPEYRYETPHPPPAMRASDRDVRVLLRLERPVIALLEDVLSADECDALIAMARPRLRPSTVVDPQTGADTIAK